MPKPFAFLTGLVCGAVLALALAAHADWNGPPGANPDRHLLERVARASEETARHLGDVARAQSDSARTLADLAQRCR